MERTEPTGFYFALPRLFVRGPRSEGNALEANLVGILVHLIAYLFAFQILLGGSSTGQQLLLGVPLAFLVWSCWLLVLYFNSWLIKLLRVLGLLRATPDRRAQSLLICLMISFFAWQLVVAGSWLRWIGFLWMAALMLNILAALLLLLRDGANPATS